MFVRWGLPVWIAEVVGAGGEMEADLALSGSGEAVFTIVKVVYDLCTDLPLMLQWVD